MIRHLTILAAALALAACTTARVERPEPIIKTVEVQVPVDDPRCVREAKAKLGAAPAYPDTEAALKTAPNLYERVKLVMAGRELRRAREAALAAALDGCD